MAAPVLQGVYLGLFCLHFFVELALLLLNIRHSRACQRRPPAEALDLLPAPEYERALDYSRARARLAIASMSLQATLTLALILTGTLGATQGLLERMPQLTEPGWGPEASGILLVYAVALPFGIASLPFSVYNQFGIESRFGFNRMTARLFLIDLAKSLGLTLVFFTPLLYLLFRLVRATPWWWLWSFALFTGVQLLLAVLYPRLIAPLFNRFTPLPAGPLRATLEEMARRLGFRASGIFLMDGSRRSGHGNAYFTGLGRSKRIVLFDTLVKELTPEQTAAVLAHEIGHQKKHHVPARLIASVLAGLAGFWLLGRSLGYGPLFRAFGFTQASAPAALVLLLYFTGPLAVLFRPAASWISRRQEHAADRFAYREAGGGEAFVEALGALSRRNLSNPTPHPWASFYFASHPAVLERIRALRA